MLLVTSSTAWFPINSRLRANPPRSAKSLFSSFLRIGCAEPASVGVGLSPVVWESCPSRFPGAVMSRPQQMTQLLDQVVEFDGPLAELAHRAGDFLFPRFPVLQHHTHTGPDKVRKASRALCGAQLLQAPVFLFGETKADQPSSAVRIRRWRHVSWGDR